MFFHRQLQETQMSVATKLGEAEHKIQQLQSGWCMITVTSLKGGGGASQTKIEHVLCTASKLFTLF